MQIQQQLKSKNDASKEQQKDGLTETQICSILNSIQQFLQQYKENIRCLCYILYIMLIMIKIIHYVSASSLNDIVCPIVVSLNNRAFRYLKYKYGNAYLRRCKRLLNCRKTISIRR